MCVCVCAVCEEEPGVLDGQKVRVAIAKEGGLLHSLCFGFGSRSSCSSSLSPTPASRNLVQAKQELRRKSTWLHNTHPDPTTLPFLAPPDERQLAAALLLLVHVP